MVMITSAPTRFFISAKLACTMLFIIWGYAFWPIIYSTTSTYINSGFDYHGLLIIPLVLFFITLNRFKLKKINPVYNHYGLIFLLSSSIVWLLAAIAKLDILSQFAAISMLLSIVMTIYGTKITNIVLLPLLCLYLLAPIGANIFHTVSKYFSFCLVKIFSMSEIPVYWENQQIYSNNHIYDIHLYLHSFKYAMLFLACGCVFALLRTKNIIVFLTIAVSFFAMPLAMIWITLYCFILLNNIWDSIPIELSKHSIIIISWCCSTAGLLQAFVLSKFISAKKQKFNRFENIDWHTTYIPNKFNWFFPMLLSVIIILILPTLEKKLSNHKHYKQNTHITCFDHNKVHYSFTQAKPYLEPEWSKVKEHSKKIKIHNKTLNVCETIFINHTNKYKMIWTINYINGYLTTNTAATRALSKIYTLTPQGLDYGIITVSTLVEEDLNIERNILRTALMISPIFVQ